MLSRRTFPVVPMAAFPNGTAGRHVLNVREEKRHCFLPCWNQQGDDAPLITISLITSTISYARKGNLVVILARGSES